MGDGSGDASGATRPWLVVSRMDAQATQQGKSQDICRRVGARMQGLSAGANRNARRHQNSDIAPGQPQRSSPKWHHQQEYHHQQTQKTPMRLSNASLEALLLAMIGFGAAAHLHAHNNNALAPEEDSQRINCAVTSKEATSRQSVTARASKLASSGSYYSSFRTAGTSSAFTEEGMI